MRMSLPAFQKMMLGSHAKIAKSFGGEDAIKPETDPRVKSQKIIIDGFLFDSKSEGRVYSEYKIDPAVKIVELQPVFELIPAFIANGKSYKPTVYTADFRIIESGVEWIVDVKSLGTLKANSKSHPIRRKLLLMQNPGLRYREIIFIKNERIIKNY